MGGNIGITTTGSHLQVSFQPNPPLQFLLQKTSKLHKIYSNHLLWMSRREEVTLEQALEPYKKVANKLAPHIIREWYRLANQVFDVRPWVLAVIQYLFILRIVRIIITLRYLTNYISALYYINVKIHSVSVSNQFKEQHQATVPVDHVKVLVPNLSTLCSVFSIKPFQAFSIIPFLKKITAC